MRTASARWITDWLKNRVEDKAWLADHLPGSAGDSAEDIFYVASVLTAMASGAPANELPASPDGDFGQIIRAVSGQAVRVGVVPVAPPEAAGAESAPETRIVLCRGGILPNTSHRLGDRHNASNRYESAGAAGFVRSIRSSNECPQGP